MERFGVVADTFCAVLIPLLLLLLLRHTEIIVSTSVRPCIVYVQACAFMRCTLVVVCLWALCM